MMRFECGRFRRTDGQNALVDFLVPMDDYPLIKPGFACQMENNEGIYKIEIQSVEKAEKRNPSRTFEDYMLIQAKATVF